MVIWRTNLPFVLLVCLCTANWASAAELVLEVIELHYRTVGQVLPVVQPLVPPPGTVSGMDDSLIIRTTPESIAEIRRVLAVIDRQPRRLLITVCHGADLNCAGAGVEHSGFAISGNVHAAAPRGHLARDGHVQVGGTDNNREQARAYSSQALDNDRTSQQIQVLDGEQAFVHLGASIPVANSSRVANFDDGYVVGGRVATVEYREVLMGLHVRPRLSGKHVTVDVSAQWETPGDRDRAGMNLQRLSTTVSGRLGEWLEIGGIVSGRAFAGPGAVYRTNTLTGDNRRVLLKVDEFR